MKKALITGLNAYPSSGLRGCVNDALLTYKIVRDYFKFDTKNIKVATDRECTKQGILEMLKWLVTDVKPGDTVYWHFSGHGTQIVVNDITSSSDPDGLSECPCPIDIEDHWDDPIRDSDLNRIFGRLPTSAHILVSLDMCHSGSGLRNRFKPGESHTEHDWVNKFLPPPPSNLTTNPALLLDEDLNWILPDRKSKAIGAVRRSPIVSTLEQGSAVLISGCADNEVSADAWINGKYSGALTFYMAETLQQHQWKISYKDLVTEVNLKLDQQNYDQNPQLESRPELQNNLFLGGPA
jgi:metacaspase-1